ncbi:MAG: hypothetical protein ACI4MZ_04955 [Christensenellales bacterium]
MQSVRTLFRLDLKSRYGTTNADKNAWKQTLGHIGNAVFFLLVYAVIIVGIYYLTNVFVTRSGLRMEFLVIVATLTICLATIVATGNVIKNLYQNGDNEMLLRFPVSGKEILVAKSIYCYLHNFVVCLLLMLPFYISFGVVTHAAPGDYFAYIGIVLFSTLVPFFVANIIAVPVMKVMNAVKNQFLLVLIITIIVVCVAFAFYLTCLSNVLSYLKDSKQSIFSPDMIQRYRNFAKYAYPFNWYAQLINGMKYGGLSAGRYALRFLYLVLINAVLGVLAYFVATKEYYKTILYGIETQKASFKKKIKDVRRPVGYALFKREFYLILRSFNYSFQYFAMACAAPVMVFFCNRLAATMGTESIGAGIMPGLTLMVIIIFITIIVSFASTCISREGASFYHTKVIPVSYTNQILVKFILYSLTGTISVALCCALSGGYYSSEAGNRLLTPLDIGAIFGIAEMLVLSLTCLSMIADIKSPTFNVSGDGELVAANKNVALAMIVGIIVAVAYGLFAMIFSFLPLQVGGVLLIQRGDMDRIYLILSVISIVLLAGSLAGLFVNLNKRYQKIIP